MIAAVIVGTFAGRWLLSRLSRERFVPLFEVLLSLIALYLIGGGLFASIGR